MSQKPVEAARNESLFDSGLRIRSPCLTWLAPSKTNSGHKVPDSDLTPRKFESISSIGRYIESRS